MACSSLRHMQNAMIKLLLAKPLHASKAADEKGVPLVLSKAIYEDSASAGKRHKADPDRNQFDAFRDTWLFFWEHTVQPAAKITERRLHKRKGWPAIWKCIEVFREQDRLGRKCELQGEVGELAEDQRQELLF